MTNEMINTRISRHVYDEIISLGSTTAFKTTLAHNGDLKLNYDFNCN